MKNSEIITRVINLFSIEFLLLSEINNMIYDRTGELRKCLVFVLSSSEISVQSKNQIIAKCNVMKNRFKRQDDLLTFISPSQALDIIFQTEGDFNSWIKTCATLSQVWYTISLGYHFFFYKFFLFQNGFQVTTTYQTVTAISRPAQMAIAVNNPRISTPTVVQQKDTASVRLHTIFF